MNVKKEKKSQQSLKKTNEKKKQPLPMQKVKKEMHKIEVRDPSYVSEDMKLQLASQIMTPERSQSGNAIMSPSETPSVSQAAHFRIVKIIPNPSSDYTLTVKPTLTPLSVTTSQQYEVSTLFFNAYIGGSGALEGLAFDADFKMTRHGRSRLKFIHVTSEVKATFSPSIGYPMEDQMATLRLIPMVLLMVSSRLTFSTLTGQFLLPVHSLPSNLLTMEFTSVRSLTWTRILL